MAERPGKTKVTLWLPNALVDALDALLPTYAQYEYRGDLIKHYTVQGLISDGRWPRQGAADEAPRDPPERRGEADDARVPPAPHPRARR